MAIDKPAIEGGAPIRAVPLPYATQFLGQEEIDAAVDTLKSAWITTGPRVKAFEEAFSAYTGAGNTVALYSCTSALNLSVHALALEPGDEIVTTPLTYIATAQAAVHSRAVPVFADIREDTFNIDPDDIERRITERTRAIMPVHYGGVPADLDRINEIAAKHGLKVIEDAAHAAGAEYKGKKIGNHGNISCFSFHAIKNMTTIEGGAVTTDDAELAASIRTAGFFGIPNNAYKRASSEKPWEYFVEELGFKCNMPDISAAIGLVQLGRLDGFNSIRAGYVDFYNRAFSGSEELITPSYPPETKPSFHLYVVRIKEEMLKVDRDRILAALRAENIFANIHYLPVYRHPWSQKTFAVDPSEYPVTERVYKSIITLPLFPKMKEEDLQSVVDALTRIIAYYRI